MEEKTLLLISLWSVESFLFESFRSGSVFSHHFQLTDIVVTCAY